VEPPPPAPFEEGLSFDFGLDSAALAGGEMDFSRVRDATDRDEIAQAVLQAMARRFSRAAIFSSRSEGVAGWAAVGEGTDTFALREVAIPWTEPSVFLNTRLTRSFHLGSLPEIPGHDRITAALGGAPEECVVEPVFIGERPVAFLVAADGRRGPIAAEDVGYLHELARTAAVAFENAIRLKKKEI
jgi:GAF domain-containing protein